VLSIPLIINKQTGIKFGKTEAGAVWLDSKKTSVTMFYQFWINQPDEDAIEFLKTYTMLEINEIEKIAKKQIENPKSRIAQKKLAYEVTRMIHGEKSAAVAQDITETLTGTKSLKELGLKTKMELVKEIPFIKVHKNSSVLDILVDTKLAQSKTEARNFLKSNAISINNEKISEEILDSANFVKGLALLRKGKAYRDSALIQLR
jgi:tyrosyl-tRNA synthetase